VSRRSWTRFEWVEVNYTDLNLIHDETMRLGILREREWESKGLTRVAQNNLYTVDVNVGEAALAAREVIWLSIRRRERARLPRDWRDLQRIKAEIVGPEHEAVEIFPAESRLVDSADQFHLWVIPRPLYRDDEGRMMNCFPFGWSQRFVKTQEETRKLLDSNQTNRKFDFTSDDYHPPLMTPEQIESGCLLD
jgi:hypothetical protein